LQHQATILEAFYKDNPIGIAQAERLEPMHPDGNGFGERFGECGWADCWLELVCSHGLVAYI